MRVLLQALLEDGSADGFALLAALDRFCLGVGMFGVLLLGLLREKADPLGCAGSHKSLAGLHTRTRPHPRLAKCCLTMNTARFGAASPPGSREAQGLGQNLPYAIWGKCVHRWRPLALGP